MICALCRILEKYVVNETNQPEDKDKNDEKYGVDHSHEGLAVLNLPDTFFFAPCPGLADLVFSQCVDVGLYQDVHEGFEETEDQPAVDHLDVGRWRQIGIHAMKKKNNKKGYLDF